MLSHISSLVSQSFVHCGVIPRMVYTSLKYWKRNGNVATQVNIISKYIDEPQYLFDITHSKEFNILNTFITRTNDFLTIKELVKVLNVYKPTYEECKYILMHHIGKKLLSADLYDALVVYYPELSKLITQDNIANTFIHHKFKHLPISQLEEDDMFYMIHNSVDEFLYIYPSQETILVLSLTEVTTVDVRILSLVLDALNPDLYSIAYWRLYNKFPHMDIITNFALAYYVRKYDPELYKTLDKNIQIVDRDWLITIDTSTDLEVMLDVVKDSHEVVSFNILEEIRDNDESSHINHWLTIVIHSIDDQSMSTKRLHLDDCNACKHFLSKI